MTRSVADRPSDAPSVVRSGPSLKVPPSCNPPTQTTILGRLAIPRRVNRLIGTAVTGWPARPTSESCQDRRRGAFADPRYRTDLLDRGGAESFERAEVPQQRPATHRAKARDRVQRRGGHPLGTPLAVES